MAEDWRRKRWMPLDLAPLSLMGSTDREGGGLLFHRPANPEVPSLQNRQEEFDTESPRRFHPRVLPAGLIQAVGHSRHQKLLKELHPWHAEGVAAASPARLRTLTVSEQGIRYEMGVSAPLEGHAVMHMLDVDMNHQDPTGCEVLRLQL